MEGRAWNGVRRSFFIGWVLTNYDNLERSRVWYLSRLFSHDLKSKKVVSLSFLVQFDATELDKFYLNNALFRSK